MSQDALLNIMTIAIVVAAVAIVIQVILLSVMAWSSWTMKKQVSQLVPKLEPIIEKSQALITKIEPMTETGQRILEDVRRYASEFSTKGTELLDLSQKQLVRVDEVLAEATGRARAQMDRVELVLDDTVNRFQETTTLLQNGVLRPLRQLNAITAGVRTALAMLTGNRRTTVEHATHDEEMFI